MMVGHWCLNGDDPAAELGNYVHRNSGVACDDILDVEHAAYFTNEYGCQIKTARQIAPSAYVVHTNCGETPDNQWTADALFQAIDDQLYVSDCPNGQCPKPLLENCVLVMDTPDGFLAVRKEPTVRSALVKKAIPGDIIYTDTSGIWTHVFSDDHGWDGWVIAKYVEHVTCPELK